MVVECNVSQRIISYLVSNNKKKVIILCFKKWVEDDIVTGRFKKIPPQWIKASNLSIFRQQNHLGASCRILNDAERRTLLPYFLKLENSASCALWSLSYLNKNEISLGQKLYSCGLFLFPLDDNQDEKEEIQMAQIFGLCFWLSKMLRGNEENVEGGQLKGKKVKLEEV